MAKREKIVTKTKKEVPVTVCGALSRTGPSIHQKPKAGGGKVFRIKNHGKKAPTLKEKVKNMLVEASKGEI